MRKLLALLLVFFAVECFALEKADTVIVKKSEARLYLYKNGKVIKEYHVSFGANPKGPKQQAGDEKTPEGKYVLDYKNPKSKFYKAIHISYPNNTDVKNAKARSVNPGGNIMIHGQKNGLEWASFVTQWFNWTDGCIAVTNTEMDEIWEAIDAGTPIEILP